MSWVPIGPSAVFAPRRTPFMRLSLRNEWGQQCLVSSIAVDPTDAQRLYVVHRPWTGGTSAFRTGDGGASWQPTAEDLQRADPSVDPSCLAVNPAHPNIVYLGTWGTAGVHVSTDHGASWGSANRVPARVRKLIVDPRTAATPATTVLYAATDGGVYRSPDGGRTWSQVIAGDVWSLEAHMPASGTAHFYATVPQQGVFHANDASTPAGWVNLNTLGIGLPAHTAATPTAPTGNFDVLLVDFCRRNPQRAYVLVLNGTLDADGQLVNRTTAIWTTSSPRTSWATIAPTSPPDPWYGYYTLAFGVAPNSPGDGANDVLFFNTGFVNRSTNSGATWAGDAPYTDFHADQHALAFFPPDPPAGTIPVTYIGCDGGIAKSTRVADPGYAFGVAPADFNEGTGIVDSGSWQSLNHGMHSLALGAYASPTEAPTASYIGAGDTGVSAGSGSPVWRSFISADSGPIAAAQGPDGLVIWGFTGAWHGWPPFSLARWVDRGETYPPADFPSLGGSGLGTTSNYVTDADGRLVVGSAVRDTHTTLGSTITAATAPQAATPGSMNHIIVGATLVVDEGDAAETVTVTATTATTFSAVFTKNHGPAAAVVVERYAMFRVDQAGAVTQISQDLVSTSQATIVAAHPTDANRLYCATADGRVLTTSSGATASASTVWAEVATGNPHGPISDLEVDRDGRAFVLLAQATGVGAAASPLFRVDSGAWIIQPVVGMPTDAGATGNAKLAADPIRSGVLYLARNARVHRVVETAGLPGALAGTWTFADISTGLPGQWVYDLVARELRAPGGSRVVLRCVVAARGAFEADVTAGATDAPIALYLRDHPADPGWLNPSANGVVNPYRPAERLWHYMSPDIKIDARQSYLTPLGLPPVPSAPAPGLTTDFFQTDPEAGAIPPLDHVRFGQLRDNSQNLPQSDDAWVHVRVNNRSTSAARDVRVWALYCNAAAGVPALSASAAAGNAFAFWSQFRSDGTIVPALPADSPWTPVGPPQTVTDVDAAQPRIASWRWRVPTLALGDPGHFCLAVFVHSASAPIGETTRFSVDEITPTNRQVGQKNLHIGLPLPLTTLVPPGSEGELPGPSDEPGDEMEDAARAADGGVVRERVDEYVEFHNPTGEARVADLVFDASGLPEAVAMSIRLTPVELVGASIEEAVSGVAEVRKPGATDPDPRPVRRPPLARLPGLPRLRLVDLLRRAFGKPERPSRPKAIALPEFGPHVLDAEPSAVVRVAGVKLAPFGSAAALLSFRASGKLPAGARFACDVQQWVGKELAGGVRYEIVTEQGAPQPVERLVSSSLDSRTPREEAQRIERDAERLRYVPPFARELVEERERELRRTGVPD